MDGLLLVDKPAGMTSHDVVDVIRRRFQIRRVGHGGTLDPAATGLLVLLIGQATRQASLLLGAEKEYLATLRLGVTSDTQDGQGRILETKPVGDLTRQQIEEACSRFRGEFLQQVPAYSAVRIGGKRSYALARAGAAVPSRSRRVMVHELAVLNVHLPDAELKIRCSKGTYIRTLCADIGKALGTGGILSALRRIQVGLFSIDQAVRLDACGPENLIPAPRPS